ncbi:MAG: hypothetical protein IJH65_10105 [Methanobrevibacter sp.]|nr:hypothetical protein [Methanobrevibacter sp.]
MDIVTQTEIVTRTIKHYLTVENNENGLLEDVQTIIKSITTDMAIDTPCVWINKQGTYPYGKNNLSHTQQLVSTYEFVCIDYDDDREIAQDKSENLAARVVTCILKNLNVERENPKDPLRVFSRVDLQGILIGTVPIINKMDGTPASSVTLDFVYTIDWLKCRKYTTNIDNTG